MLLAAKRPAAKPPAAKPPAATAPAGRRRRDLAARASEDTRGMLRFVVDPGRRLVPDLAGRLPGRGFWVKADRASIAAAVKKRVWDRQAGGQVIVPEDLADLLERLLLLRCKDALGLARRAGELVMGFDQVLAVLDEGQAGVLVEASDAAAHGARKLRAKQGAKQGEGACVDLLSRAELGQALGRDMVVRAWVRNGRLATRLVEDAAKLEGFRRPPLEAVESGVDEQQGMSRAR